METRHDPWQCSKENPRQPKLTGGTNYEKMNAVVKDSTIGYVFKEKTRLRKTNDGGGGALMLPPASLGPPHSLVGVHKTSPNMTNKNHSKTHFFMAKYVCS